jgi:hypothetical protein
VTKEEIVLMAMKEHRIADEHTALAVMIGAKPGDVTREEALAAMASAHVAIAVELLTQAEDTNAKIAAWLCDRAAYYAAQQ